MSVEVLVNIHFVFENNDLHETLLCNVIYKAYIRTYASFTGRQEGRIEVRVGSDDLDYADLEPVEFKVFSGLNPEEAKEGHREMVKKWKEILPNYRI